MQSGVMFDDDSKQFKEFKEKDPHLVCWKQKQL